MALPIKLATPTRDPRQELYARLQSAPADHAEALLSAYDLLQKLHDRGALDVLRGAIGSGDRLVEEIVQVANAPESIRAMRNLVILFQTVGGIDPEVLKALAGAVPKAVSETKVDENEQPGLWALLKKMRGKNFLRGLAVITSLLEGFGKNLPSKKSPE